VLEISVTSDFLCVPGSFLKLLEHIIRSTISSAEIPIQVLLSETEKTLAIHYEHNDAINRSFNLKDIEDIRHVYSIYSIHPVNIRENENTRTIRVPKLEISP